MHINSNDSYQHRFRHELDWCSIVYYTDDVIGQLANEERVMGCANIIRANVNNAGNENCRATATGYCFVSLYIAP